MSRFNLATFRVFHVYHRASDMYFAGWEQGTLWRGLGGCSYMSIFAARTIRRNLLKLPNVHGPLEIVGVRSCRYHRSKRGRQHSARCARREVRTVE